MFVAEHLLDVLEIILPDGLVQVRHAVVGVDVDVGVLGERIEAELLINEGVDIQRPRSDGITPLMACMDKCMFETAKELIEHAARCDKEVVRLSLSLSCSIAKVLNERFALSASVSLCLGRLHYGHVHGDAAW